VLQNPGVSLSSQFGTLSFSSSRGGLTSRKTLVTVDVLGLVKALTTKSDEQRCEWARHLMLQASQARSDSQLHNLYSSIERDGWAAFRLRQRAEETRSSQQSHAGDSAKSAHDREAMAAELREYAARMTAEFRRSAPAPASQPDALATIKASAAPAVEVSASGEDVLRSGVRSGVASAPVRSVPSASISVGTVPRPSTIGKRGPMHEGETAAVLLATPRWEAGSVGGRLQATLRFAAPGIGAGDSVLVLGPGGERLPLIVPSGLLHVQRAVASLSRNPREAEEYALRLDISSLSRSAAPGDRVSVGGVPLWLPHFAAPSTSLVVALPLVATDARPGSPPPPGPAAPAESDASPQPLPSRRATRQAPTPHAAAAKEWPGENQGATLLEAAGPDLVYGAGAWENKPGSMLDFELGSVEQSLDLDLIPGLGVDNT
jgi:hypothetical protein